MKKFNKVLAVITIMAGLFIGTREIYASESGTTYYVSATGTSTDGTDINDPMSYAAANDQTKEYAAGSRILLKRGDTFYGEFRPITRGLEGNEVYIGAYGEGPKPIISGAKIITDRDAFIQEGDFFKIDLSDWNNYDGYRDVIKKNDTKIYYANVGFVQDRNGKKYGEHKQYVPASNDFSNAKEKYDYLEVDKYLYIKTDVNPIDELGELTLGGYVTLYYVGDNTVTEDLHLQNTGWNGVEKRVYPIKNVTIRNCIVDNIGGSQQWGIYNSEGKFTLFGNGIQFWDGADDILVEKNIIRNVYDAGFTIQSHVGSYDNVVVRDNLFINNEYSVELWDSQSSTGIYNYEQYNNISINQGRGWSHGARRDAGHGAEFVFFTVNKGFGGMNAHDNIFYNPRRLYFTPPEELENFKEGFTSDNNTIIIDEAEQSYIQNKTVNIKEFNKLQSEYNVDANSTLSFLTDRAALASITAVADFSLDYDEIKEHFLTTAGLE